MSADGQSIAISEIEMPFGEQTSIGRVKVFDWQENNWVPKGQVLVASENYSSFGMAISLSENGDRLAIGEAGFGFEDGQSGPGRVLVYQFEMSEWIPLGTPIIGTGETSVIGTAISLSYSGERLAVGEPGFNSSGVQYGRVQLYE